MKAIELSNFAIDYFETMAKRNNVSLSLWVDQVVREHLLIWMRNYETYLEEQKLNAKGRVYLDGLYEFEEKHEELVAINCWPESGNA